MDEFEQGDFRQQLKLSDLWSNIKGTKRAVGQVVLLSLLLQVFALSTPYYVQLAVDQALQNQDIPFLIKLALFFAALIVLAGMTTILRSSILLSLGSLFGSGLSSNISRKLFRLPIDWFYRRHLGDILSRFQSVTPIRKLLAEDAPAAIVDGVLALSTLIVMAIYSNLLAFVSFVGMVGIIAVRLSIFLAQRRAQEDMLIANAREQSVLIETLRGIRSLRLSGQESLRHALWRTRMVEAVNSAIRFNRLENWQNALEYTILGIENVVVILVAISLAVEGGFTVGMIMAFLAYKVLFFVAVSTLLDRFIEFKMLDLHLERLADIALTEDDLGLQEYGNVQANLVGSIELRGVKYRYGDTEPYVLNGIDLKISNGETIAITGTSGGGKSTLIHLLLGLFRPSAGEVWIDDVPIHTFGYQNYHRQVSAVLQDDTLFAGSLGDNITMFDENPDMEKVVKASTAAAIYSDVKKMPMGFDTLVGDMGNALSGGQQQRVILARALYREPKVLVLDEATSHLDEETEKSINEAIANLGITRVIVAHRKETIAKADRVVRLDRGLVTAIR
ncbi:peptidase domain-containing ABC transporter [Parasphingorhabdus cellanae]|uniref:Peptidase domain-containing ABC transporter n=1 Tax=Parasphingorhabdus cellanae TaxID=2806553 RepID=A0ABX7T5N3_9SPHN|nr:peptidase domain-containing ABC transporter [Parasphingorhabdus cellanae]QTD56904.1 peptidase domain-containing ABC transporter [Parasphingorhabdus cellanae]